MSKLAVEQYFDESDELYRQLWNPDGSKHWGYFIDVEKASTFEDFLRASDYWTECLLERSKLSQDSEVLEIGSANGVVSTMLAQQTGATVIGIDISETHVQQAINNLKGTPNLKLSFQKASATSLPFENNSFTHVWSQSTFSHIADNNSVLSEAFRVLKPGGLLIFDDVIVPNKSTSVLTQELFFDRLFIPLKLTAQEYKDAIMQAGFDIIESEELSEHMKKCYEIQAERTRDINLHRSEINQQHFDAISNKEIGWHYFLCKKV